MLQILLILKLRFFTTLLVATVLNFFANSFICHLTSSLATYVITTFYFISLLLTVNTFATLVYLATYCCCSGPRLSPRRIWTTIFCRRPDGGTYRHQRYFHPSPARQWTRGQQEQIEQHYSTEVLLQCLTHRVITPRGPKDTRLFLAQNFLSWWGNCAWEIQGTELVTFYICVDTISKQIKIF